MRSFYIYGAQVIDTYMNHLFEIFFEYKTTYVIVLRRAYRNRGVACLVVMSSSLTVNFKASLYYDYITICKEISNYDPDEKMSE